LVFGEVPDWAGRKHFSANRETACARRAWEAREGRVASCRGPITLANALNRCHSLDRLQALTEHNGLPARLLTKPCRLPVSLRPFLSNSSCKWAPLAVAVTLGTMSATEAPRNSYNPPLYRGLFSYAHQEDLGPGRCTEAGQLRSVSLQKTKRRQGWCKSTASRAGVASALSRRQARAATNAK